MNIVFFSHPDFLQQQSMSRYTAMLAHGMRQRGHYVEVWSPQATFFNYAKKKAIKKWLGYIDSFILFPATVRKKLQHCPDNTLFVFTDHALGPWVPLVLDRPHIIHCHDFLAQRSALGEIEENTTSVTGKLYQRFIRRGYKKGDSFISTSVNTQNDLHRFLGFQPTISEMVYNGLNQDFRPLDPTYARIRLAKEIDLDLKRGFLMHIGGNSWYKNRPGVIEIYNAWREGSAVSLPLLLIGKSPNDILSRLRENSPYKQDIHFLVDLDDEGVRLAYAGATVLLFPSLSEGFGWPVAEAMASGCPVITTNCAPMTEVAGKAGFYIARRPSGHQEVAAWAKASAEVVNEVVTFSPEKREEVVQAGLENARRFDPQMVLNCIEAIYFHMV